MADGKGDHEIEPAGTVVMHLAVSENTIGFRTRLYWSVGNPGADVLKSLDL